MAFILMIISIPYRIAGKEFPDYQAYKRYGNGLTKMHGAVAIAILS
jgi:hypothetical protein